MAEIDDIRNMNDQELLENLDYYQEEIIYYAGVLDGLTIKGDS